MSDYVIFTDSTCDLSAEHAKSLGVNVIPLSFIFEGKQYQDGGMPYKEFYDLLREKKNVTTSQINTGAFIDAFEPHLKAGQDILYIAFTSSLSGTYASAKIAQEELSDKYPDRKLMIVDSLCACAGEGLLVHYAATRKNDGMPLDDLVEWLEQNKKKVCHWIVVEDLFHLKRGGRLSSVSALVGTMLGVKPVLRVDDNGKLVPADKVRGRQAALASLVERMKQTATVTPDDVVFIAHADAIDDANFVKELILKEFNVKEVKVNYIGTVVGSHAGPGTIALFFMGKER